MAAMDDAPLMTRKFNIVSHGTTEVEVVYTNDITVVQSTIEKFERLLLRDTHRFVGLDLEYTSNQEEVAVFQLAMFNHVSVFQFCR